MFDQSKVKPISAALKVTVHPDHERRLSYIDSEDYSGVARKVAEYLDILKLQPSERYFERGVFALKQYYAVALFDPANGHAVSRSLDPFWHFHVLHTEQYVEFCNKVVGEYMHHRPLNRENLEHVATMRRLYGYTYEILEKLFSSVDGEFWPSNVSDVDLICWHKGNQTIYREIQAHRLFEPTSRGVGYDL